MPGPLHGYRVIELAGIGPVPFAAMLLADLGADVLRIDRADAVQPFEAGVAHADVTRRGRRSVALDLRHPDGRETLLDLLPQADALIEGFRPGVAERLGFGPQACLARQPRLVFGRMTGWGQHGPYAQAAGHDIDYIAVAGALAHFGRAGSAPVPPLNLVGDFGGGAMFLALGVVAALLEAQRSGRGQVIDAAMVDGTAVLMAMFWSMRALGQFDPARRGANLLDTGTPYYDVYECADGRHVAVGALEPRFFAELLRRTGLDQEGPRYSQQDPGTWPALRDRLTALFATRTQAQWCEVFDGTDACVAPVLTMTEATAHPHNVARGTFTAVDGAWQPRPAPRFSRTVAELSAPPAHPGQHTTAALADWCVGPDRIKVLISTGAAVQAYPKN
jgi:alpha-methylacyl-CoA racemase